MDYILDQVKEKGIVKYIESYVEDLEITDNRKKCMEEIEKIKYLISEKESTIIINNKGVFKSITYMRFGFSNSPILECLGLKIFHKNTRFYYTHHSYICSKYPVKECEKYKHVILRNMEKRER